MLKRLAASAFVFAAIMLTGVGCPGQAQAQRPVSQSVAVCDPAYPGRCVKPAADGSISVTGAFTSNGATAAAGGTVAVTAGTGKPQAIDLFSSTSVQVKDALGASIDWTAAVPVTQSGTWIMQPGNTANTTPWLTTQTPSAAAAAGISIVSSTAAEACHVLKASAGNFYGASGYIGAAGFLMLFDATSAPADGAVTPVAWAYAPAAGSWSLDYGAIPAAMSTGITLCASSTGPLTKTAYSTNNVISGRVK